MPTVELNLESQIASEITRAELQTLISTNAVERKQYYITNAVNNTRKVAVFYRSPNQTTFGAVDVNTGVYGRYFIVQDMFIPILEAQGAVLTYINLASFPVSGAANTVYIAQDTGTGYTWNGSAYVALSGGTVFAANFGALPVTGTVDTLYITTDNGNSYLWDGSEYVQTSSGTPPIMVESVVAGDDINVDATDPANPTVSVTPNTFLRLLGTEAGFPVTGSVEVTDNVLFFRELGTKKVSLEFNNENDIKLRYTDSSTGVDSQVFLNGDSSILLLFQGATYATFMEITEELIKAHSNNPSYQGIAYNSDIESNLELESLVAFRSLKSRLWNKAGAPTTSDDSTRGYVANRSLLLDTTSGIIHKCLDATAGAAVWEVYYDPKTTIQSVTISGASVTTTANTAQNITGLVTPTLPENSVWFFEIDMLISCTGAGGVRLGFTAPSGATGQISVIGTATSLTTYLQTSTTGALATTATNRFNGGSYVRMTGRVKIGATAGAVQLQFASGTSGQTSTIFGDFESVMNLKRLV